MKRVLAMILAIGLVAITAFGCSKASPPEADFSCDPDNGNAPLTVQFTDESTGDITSWAWDFDDDGDVDSTEQNPTHEYETPGKYTVSLEVTGRGGSDTKTRTDLIEVSAPSGDAVGMMEQLPAGGDYFIFADSEGMRANEGLQDLYDWYSDEAVADMEAETGISPDDISAVAITISSSGEGVAVFKGSFELDNIRDALMDQDYDEGEYNGVETWESYDGGALALVSDSLIISGATIGDVKDCIDVIRGEGGSLNENEDLTDMMDRLPAGIAVACAEIPSTYVSQFTSYYGYTYLNGVEVAGLSLGVEGENVILTVVLKFDNESDADDANDQIKNDIEDAIETYLADYIDPSDVEINVTQDNEYLTMTAEMSIETLVGIIEQAMEDQY